MAIFYDVLHDDVKHEIAGGEGFNYEHGASGTVYLKREGEEESKVVKSYKFLGLEIDAALQMKLERRRRRELERKLKKAEWILRQKNLSRSAKYHLWTTLFRSKIWYMVIPIAAFSKQIRTWVKTYIYRSLKILFNLKGAVNTETLYLATFDSTPEQTIDKLYE